MLSQLKLSYSFRRSDTDIGHFILEWQTWHFSSKGTICIPCNTMSCWNANLVGQILVYYHKGQNTPTRVRLCMRRVTRQVTRRVTRRQTRKSRDCPHTNATINATTNATCEAWKPARQPMRKKSNSFENYRVAYRARLGQRGRAA